MEDYIFGLVLVLIIALVAQLIIALKFASCAEEKGYDRTPYFWVCFLLGMIGYCMVAALPDLYLHQKLNRMGLSTLKNRSEISSSYKQNTANNPIESTTPKDDIVFRTWECPYCLTTNQSNHKQCKNCGKPRS